MDYLIKNGLIYDGSGNKPYKSDILIQQDKIADVGHEINNESVEIIDAHGFIVTPGFIDIHRHCDIAVLKPGFGHLEIAQGITYAVAGNCGLSAVPCNPPFKDLLNEHLQFGLGRALPDMPHTFNEYTEKIKNKQMPINLGLLIGTGTIRVALKGFDKSPFSKNELYQGAAFIDEALSMGALGASLGIMYFPEYYNTAEDYIQLLKPVAKKGGFVAVHVRGEGDSLVSSIEEAILIGKMAEVPIHISHFKSCGANNWNDKIHISIEKIEKARNSGQDVTVEFYPYDCGSTSLLTMVPPSFLNEGAVSAIDSLKDKTNVAKLRDEMYKKHPGWDNFTLTLGWERIVISSLTNEHNKKYIGKTVAEITKEYGFYDEVEFAAYLLHDEKGKIVIINKSMCQKDIETIARLPYSLVVSDAMYGGEGSPHPRLHGAFPKIIREFVNEKNILSLEQAIHKMTCLPAKRMNKSSKGLIKKGFDADLLIFDPNNFKDKATYEKSEIMAEGLYLTFVGGKKYFKDDFNV